MSNGAREQTGGSTATRAPGFLDSALQSATGAATDAFGGNEAPTATAARNLVGQSLRGDFLSPDSNPFLQQTFDLGADKIQQRLDSQFAGAGRNIGASQPVAADELGSFAANLFGDNFQRERDRQTQSIFGESTVNPLDQLIRRLGGVGQFAGEDTAFSQEVEQKKSPADRAASILGSFFGAPG